MTDALLMAGAAAIVYVAFALLALTQERHRESVAGRQHASVSATANVWRWRQMAALALAAGLGICIAAHGPQFGAILWVLLLCACALAVALTLTWQPQRLRWVARLVGP